MLEQIRRWFSRARPPQPDRDGDPDQLNLEEVYQDLQKLVTKNRVSLAANEKLANKTEARIQSEKAILRFWADDDFQKRCSLRRLKVYQKRMTRIARCSSIYNDNINVQTRLSDRLEDMRVAGNTTITAQMLDNIAIDHEEMYAEHREFIGAANSMMSSTESPETFDDNEELQRLAKECGIS